MDIPHRYWDSDCFLGWFNAVLEPDKAATCEGVVSKAQAGKLKLVTSAITLIEVIKIKGKPAIQKDQEDKINRFFANKFIVIQQVDRLMGELGRELIWKHGLKPKDAIHVATALHHELDTFDTFDEELIRFDGKLGNPIKLRIGKPNISFQFRPGT